MNSYRQPGNYIEVEPGVEIYYEDRGAGTPVVFVPGWTFTSEVFIHQMEHFSKTHRVVAFDPRSQGRSSITLHGNDYTTHAADLAKIFKVLDLQDVVLVGWSFGCLEAWGYIKQEGAKALRAMVSIDLSPKPLSVDPQDWVEGPLDEIAGAYNAYLRSRKGQRDFVTYYADEIMVQRQLTQEEMLWIVEQSLKTPPNIASALFASGMFANHMEEAKLVDESLPALSIIAEHWADTAIAFLHKHFPKTKTAVLGGHMMFWEYPEKFNTILGDFITSL
ncbi:MAG TPA: alpha/beta hydrolase [Levilinea sp.]|nr:alpha/beta hydrolase [Levilinea sp.]